MKKTILSLLLIIANAQIFALNPSNFTINRITAPYFVVDGNQPTILTTAYVGFEVINSGSVTNAGLVFTVDSISTSVSGQSYSILSPTSKKIIVGTLAPGQSKVCYFYVSYPTNVSPTATFHVSLTDSSSTKKTTTFSIYNRSCISANAGGVAVQYFLNQNLLGGIINDTITYQVGNVKSGNEADFQAAVSSQFDPTKMQLLSTKVVASNTPGIPIGTTDSLYFVTGAGSVGDTIRVLWVFRVTGYNFTNYLLPYCGFTSGSTNYKYELNSSLGSGSPVAISSSANPLTITKTSDKSIYTVCDTASFTVTIANPGGYGITVDSITDQIPTGFSFLGFTNSSDISSANSSSYPQNGATGNILFAGGVILGGNTSYYIPASGSINLIYRAKTVCSPSLNLLTKASGYVGPTQFAFANNTLNVESVLPVSLLSFNAKQYSTASVALSWSAINEEDVKSYIIQYKNDNINWEDISINDAPNKNPGVNQYDFIHSSPVKGNNYYRLMIVHTNGEVTYSNIIYFDEVATTSDLEIYPTPIIDRNLQFYIGKAGMISLLNYEGQIVMTKHFEEGLQNINVGMLSKGVYIIKTESESKKFVIQ